MQIKHIAGSLRHDHVCAGDLNLAHGNEIACVVVCDTRYVKLTDSDVADV